MRVTVLGCGGSDGVPRIGGPDGTGDWGACDPAEPRNCRTRSSVHIEVDGVGLLIDTPPDLRAQLLTNHIKCIDAVLYTHEHADHCHGIHELRRLAANAGRVIPVYATSETIGAIRRRFAYIFETSPGSPYRPVAEARVFDGPFSVGGVSVVPFDQDHGFGQRTIGFRIGPMAYSTDAAGLPDAAFDALEGVRLWIVDCQQEEPHPTHAHLDLALSWIERVRPERALLTHLGHKLDYRQLLKVCPEGVEPAYDGLTIDL